MPTVTLTLGGASQDHCVTPPFSNYWNSTTIIGNSVSLNNIVLQIVEANTFLPTFASIISATLNITTAFAGHTTSSTEIFLYAALNATDFETSLAFIIGSYGVLNKPYGTYAIPLTHDPAWPYAAQYPYIGYLINGYSSNSQIGITSANVVIVYNSIDVTAITPTNGPIKGGTPIVISGDGFSTVSSVTFDGIAATSVVVVNSNTITCITPPHATGVYIDVVITATDGSIATLPASYQYRNVPFSWTINGIPSIAGNPPTVPLDYNNPINIVTTGPNGVPTGVISPGAIPVPDGITTPIYITYTPISGSPITIEVPSLPPGIDPTTPIPPGTIPTLPLLPGINPSIPVVLSGTPTEFSGTVALGLFTITIVNGAGIYVITPGNTADTLYVNSPINNTTAQV